MKKIELKKITYNARLSEETSAYAAQVWVDGEHIADVSNDGHGGCDRQYPAKGKTNADIQALNEYCKATYPKVEVEVGEGSDFTFEQDLAWICNKLLIEWQFAKDLRRLLGRKVAVIKTNGKMYTLQINKAPPAALAAAIARIKAEGGKVLNELPFDEALKLYHTVAQ